MPAASILIKPASSNCNIDCRYCFYKCLSSSREEYSKGFMSFETLEQLVIRAVEYADGYLAFAFQGGEPMLAGMDFFRRAAELQKKYNKKKLVIENTIQTNGTLINQEWARFFAENNFLVGLSLDGPKKLHGRYRKNVQGISTFEQVMRAAGLLEKYHADFNILSVITNETVKNASSLYHFYKRNGFSYIQLIPCMDEQERTGRKREESFAVDPIGYGRFLCEFFDLWYEDFKDGLNMDIRMFSNLAQMAAGYPAEECGMNGNCTCYFVVEGDGSVYPCDFYCLDEWKLGTVEQPFKDLANSDKAKKFVDSSRRIPSRCQNCAWYSLCRGGCRRWREGASSADNLNVLCQAYEIFFEHAWERLKKLGKYIERRYGHA